MRKWEQGGMKSISTGHYTEDLPIVNVCEDNLTVTLWKNIQIKQLIMVAGIILIDVLLPLHIHGIAISVLSGVKGTVYLI